VTDHSDFDQIDIEKNPPVNAPFHWRDETYFQRLTDGSVLITKRSGPRRGIEIIPPSEWASIVAHVSTWGESAESHKAALDYHNGTGIKP
jgi:hypothetical protein